MSKKIISRFIPLTLVFALLLAMLPLAASAESSGDFSYTVLEDGTAEISGYTGSGGNVEIPAELDGYSVSSIGEDAFYDCTSLTSITIPDSVTSIGNYALDGCSSLASITIPDSVTSIGYRAFYGCNALAAINVAEGNENYSSVDGVLFDNDGTTLIAYPAGKEQISYVIPDGVTSIIDGAFEGTANLESITIPNSVTGISDSAFYDCSSPTSITIPDSVTSIGRYAFYGCSSLASVSLGSGVTSIGSGAFRGCTSLASVSIGSGVTSIGSWAFRSCSSLASITIPDSVTCIEEGAFDGCTSLASVSIGSGVTSIGSWAFDGCTSLASVSIGSGVTSIESYAFRSCTSLTSITIPDSVTCIEEGAFEDCTSLASVSIGSGVTSIGSWAFRSCTSLTSITIPDGVTSIGYSAFYGCTALAAINVAEENGAYSSIDGVLFNKDGTTLITYPQGKGQTYAIPDSVTFIGIDAFESCTSLESVLIGSGVTSNAGDAFSGCTALTAINVAEGNENYSSIDGVLFNKDGTKLIKYPTGKGQTYIIPDSVTSIGEDAFSGCTSLESVSIGSGVISIGDWAFVGCSNLASVTLTSSVESIGDSAFYLCGSLSQIYYYGDEASWEEIAIEDGNDPLINACRIYIDSDEEIYTAESVSVIAPASVLEEGAVFKAEPVSAEDLNIADTQEYDLNNALIYDIYFEKDEQRVQPGATVTVYIIVPETLVAETCKVIYIDDEGNLTDMNAECENGVMVFTTDQFGLYALADNSAESEFTPGDVNSDGKIDSADATLVLQFYAGIIDENTAGYNNSAADLNGDGNVNSADATLILQIYAGIA